MSLDLNRQLKYVCSGKTCYRHVSSIPSLANTEIAYLIPDMKV